MWSSDFLRKIAPDTYHQPQRQSEVGAAECVEKNNKVCCFSICGLTEKQIQRRCTGPFL